MKLMGFTVIDNSILEDETLTSKEKLLYIAIKRYYSKSKGYSYPNYNQLKKISSIGNNKTLIKSLDKLMELNLIKKQTLKGVGNRYFIDSAKKYQVQKCTTFRNVPLPSAKKYQVKGLTKYKNERTPSTKVNYDPVQKCTTTNTKTNTKTSTSSTTNNNNNLFTYYEKSIGRVITPKEVDTLNSYLQDGLSEEVIKKAIDESVVRNVRNLAYIKAILNRYLEEGKTELYHFENENKESKYDTEEDINNPNYKRNIIYED